MALINCEECGHEMSESAKSCPQCGYIPKKPKDPEELVFEFFVHLFKLVFWGVFTYYVFTWFIFN